MSKHFRFTFKLFCRDLHFLAWRKLLTKILYVENNYKYEVWDEDGQRWLKVDENIRNTHASLMPFVMLGPFILSIKNSRLYI